MKKTSKLTFLDKEALDEIDWKEMESLFAATRRKRPFHQARRLQRSFANSYSASFAFLDQKLVGCGRTLSDGQVHGWIHDVMIHPDFQGKGIGKALMQVLIKQLAGVRYLGLLCSEDDVAFYEKCGLGRWGFTAMGIRQKTR